MNRATAIQLLPPYQHKKQISTTLGTGSNARLVKEILKDYPLAVKQTAKLAPRFKGYDLDSTARNVWNFLKTQVKYKEDTGLYQALRSPSALINTGQGDCKSFALFTAGIMANLGYPVTFRFVGYGTNWPGHVYILAGSGQNKKIIDAVWKAYNAEKKPYTYLKDYTMEISHITGIGCDNCSEDIGAIHLKKAVQKAGKWIKKTADKTGGAVKDAFKKGNIVQMAALVGPRTAFLQLVKLNVHNFARRLYGRKEAAFKIWEKLGGMRGELNASINAGNNRKPILGLDGIGEPVSVSIAAILAAAAPIIAAMAALLGKDHTPAEPGTPPPTTTPTPGSGNSTPTDILNAATNLLQSVQPAGPSGGSFKASPASYGPNYGTDSGNMDASQPTSPSGANTPAWVWPAAIGLGILLLAK